MLLDGKKLSEKVLLNLKKKVLKNGKSPKLLIILCGNNPESLLYTKLKIKKSKEAGIKASIKKLPENVSEQKIIHAIRNSKTDGIIVQLPLPKHLDADKILSSIPIKKDVDGLNMKSDFTPATPKGIMRLLKEYNISIKSKNITIINDSKIVGRPLAMLMLNKGATVTICNKFTKNISQHTKKSDILISGVGIPCFIKKDMIKKKAVVIDVGIAKKGKKVLGDVDFDNVKEKASHITPVPGGIGPLTIAMLLENVSIACTS